MGRHARRISGACPREAARKAAERGAAWIAANPRHSEDGVRVACCLSAAIIDRSYREPLLCLLLGSIALSVTISGGALFDVDSLISVPDRSCQELLSGRDARSLIWVARKGCTASHVLPWRSTTRGFSLLRIRRKEGNEEKFHLSSRLIFSQP